MSKDLNSMIDEVKEEIYDSCMLGTKVCSKLSRIIHWLPDGFSKNNLIYSIHSKCKRDFENGVQKDIIIQDDIVKTLRRIGSDFEFVINQNELDELYKKFQTLCNNDACTTENVVKAINQVCDFNIDVKCINPMFIRSISGFCMACKAFASISSVDSIKSNIKTFLNSYITITYGDMMSITNSLFGMGGMNMGMPGMMGNPFFSEADRQTNTNVLTGLCNVTRYITNSMRTRNDAEKRALSKINGSIIEAIETFGRS